MAKNDSRLEVLDAMRGIAAFLVVLFHARIYIFSVSLVPGGYLAVDFFFALSGLVIARAYTDRLNLDMTAGRFCVLRLIRLYPLFILGLLLGVVNVSIGTTAAPMGFGEVARMLVSEIFMLPAVGASELFPLNGPAWSLFFEMVINLVFAIWLVRARTLTMMLVVMATAMALAVASWHQGGLNIGHAWPSFHWGLARVFFSFCVGTLVHRLWRQDRFKFGGIVFVVPMVALALAMTIPIRTEFRSYFDLLVVLVVFPILLVFGARCRMPAWGSKASQFLGDTSYAIYVLHLPLLYMVGTKMRSHQVSAFIWLPIFLIGIFGLTYLVDKYYDMPVRKWLSRRLTLSGRLATS